MNFEQILRKVAAEQESKQTFSNEYLGVDPAYMAFLIGQVRKHEGTPTGKYPHKKFVRVRTPHTMSESQKVAFEFFQRHLPEFLDGFTSSELKAAFRSAALKLHPDTGGSAYEFIQLRQHHQELNKLFTK